MRNAYKQSANPTSEMPRHFCTTEGQPLPAGAQVVANSKFGACARICWPVKTAAHVAAIANRDVRTAERWLAGEYEPPLIVVFMLLQKMFEKKVMNV